MRICTFPAGLETEIGELGIRVSGGQRQRIALARAMAASGTLAPGLLVLDDPFSALDLDTEARIVAGLRQLFGPSQPYAQQCTVVLFSHRLLAFPQADLVVVLDRGRILEQGTHAESTGNGLYARIYRAQRLASTEGVTQGDTVNSTSLDRNSAARWYSLSQLWGMLKPWRGPSPWWASRCSWARCWSWRRRSWCSRSSMRTWRWAGPRLALDRRPVPGCHRSSAGDGISHRVSRPPLRRACCAGCGCASSPTCRRYPCATMIAPRWDTISRCTADVETVSTLFTTAAAGGPVAASRRTRWDEWAHGPHGLVRLGTIGAAMLALSPLLSLVAALAVLPVVLVTRYFQVRVRDAERASRQAVGLQNTHLQEMLGGVEVIRSAARPSLSPGSGRHSATGWPRTIAPPCTRRSTSP